MWQYNELYHHGIKGQKWGVRRYQNKDGTLTSAGKKRKKETSNSSSEESKARTKKIVTIGAAAATAAAIALGGYALYKSGKINPAIGTMRNVGANVVDELKRKARTMATGVPIKAYTSAKADAAKKAIKKTSKEIVESGKETTRDVIKDVKKELVSAGLLSVTGYAAKKIAVIKKKREESGERDVVADAVIKAGEKAVSRAESTIRGGSNSSHGARMGKDLTKKLGPAPQKTYSPSDETRYQAVFKSPKVNSDPEVRQTIKSLRRAGYSVEQVEQYVKML